MEETKCYCGHTTYCDCGPETLEEASVINYKKLYEGEPLTQVKENHLHKMCQLMLSKKVLNGNKKEVIVRKKLNI